MSMVIHSALLVSGGRAVRDGWIRVEGGGIVGQGDGEGWRAAAQAGDDVLDAVDIAGQGAVLTPGLIDLHGHGAAGAAYDDGTDAIRRARAHHRRHGTTRAVVSLVTARLPDLEARVTEIAQLARQDDDVLGSHLEGPFLDPAHHGAHELSLLRAPDADAVTRLLAAGVVDGAQTIRQVTIAPELPGALAAIRQIVASGAIAAIGHTDADAATTAAAIDAGATLVTHAFNAMPAIHHRRPGPIPVAAREERVVLELIADGVHVDDAVMLLLLRAAPGRVALVTDAMAATGMADGDYTLGSLEVVVADGVAMVRGTDTIAGSTLTQDAAVRRVVALGVDLPDAVDAATGVPARVLGREDLGSLRVGAVADAVLWTRDLEVLRVWTAGVPEH
ncbi:amidohydrolase family protein [Microbacterium oryzae]|uniref:N-acetylglucosamine-6-phosphate deacetylase n=1 Tax=Microbacterium oryzae TaxID=743009 RepID=UPI0025B1B5B0|nr:amidohydrolase family protein [Microbacterium oryzae]MDN3311094.1 amidohydrolase family protein [Microbacterium oryzae]